MFNIMKRNLFDYRIYLGLFVSLFLLCSCGGRAVSPGYSVPKPKASVPAVKKCSTLPQKAFSSLDKAMSALMQDIICRANVSKADSFYIEKFEDLEGKNPGTGAAINREARTQMEKILPGHGTKKGYAAFTVKGSYRRIGKSFAIKGYAIKKGGKKGAESAVNVEAKAIKVPSPEKTMQKSIDKIYQGLQPAKGRCKNVYIYPFEDYSLISPNTGVRVRKTFAESLKKSLPGAVQTSAKANADCFASAYYDRRNVSGKDSICVYVRIKGKGGNAISSSYSCFETKSLNKPEKMAVETIKKSETEQTAKKEEQKPIPCDFNGKSYYVKRFKDKGNPNNNEDYVNDVVRSNVRRSIKKVLPKDSRRMTKEGTAQMIVEGSYEVKRSADGKCQSVSLDITCRDRSSAVPQTYNFTGIQNVVECYMIGD